MGGTRVLALEDVHRSYPSPDGREGIEVLRGVNLEVAAGESVAVTGPSGSGKTTLLAVMGLLDSPTRGRILLDGADPAGLSGRERARIRALRVGFVFQSHHLLPQCTVWENVLVPTLAVPRGRGAGDAPPAGNPADRARRLLARVGLADRLGHRPGELSGGECLRAAVARALINGPAVLLADEPTGSLDADTAERLAGLLVEINREEGVSLVVVTHSAALADRMGRRLRLHRGVLVESRDSAP